MRTLACLCVVAAVAHAGLDTGRLKHIPQRLDEMVRRGEIAGAVVLVQHNGSPVAFETAGYRDLAAKDPMKRDTIFQIMSMTKPFTGAGILMLAEEGRLRLLDPVERHLPEFRNQMMVETRTPDGKFILKKPSRPITIRDLMTHTSGMIANPPPPIGDLLMTMDRTLAEAVTIYSQAPLEFEPGSRWMYSNPGIAVLGRILEVVSGMPYEKFLETRLFQPLGMTDSHIFLPAEKRGRVAQLYRPGPGGLEIARTGVLAGDPTRFREGAKYSGPEYAMYSTAGDLARFYQMLLDRGVWQGKRLMSGWAVDQMAELQTGDLAAGHNPGTGFGLTVEVTRSAAASLYGFPPGSFGHGGAFGTHGLVDRRHRMVTVFLIQRAGDARPVRDPIFQIVAAAVTE